MNNKFLNIDNVLSLIIVLISFLLISCTAEEKHKTLTFFFDGVPDPNAKLAQSDSLKQKNNENDLKQYLKSDEMHIHPPYGDKACENCHDVKSANKLNTQEPILCFQCHDDFGKNIKYIHGPAASGYCTQCHEPHQGKYNKLLIRTGQNVCYYCHEKKDVLKNEVHSGIEETKCWDCHDPHGSNEKFFLK